MMIEERDLTPKQLENLRKVSPYHYFTECSDCGAKFVHFFFHEGYQSKPIDLNIGCVLWKTDKKTGKLICPHCQKVLNDKEAWGV